MTRTEDYFAKVCAANLALARKRRADVEAFLASQPPSKPCTQHPHIERRIDPEASLQRSQEDGTPTVVYARCGECRNAAERERESQWLRKCGVPLELTGATFENFIPKTEQDRQHLATVRRFSEIKRGFLVFLGGYGLGKTHLAVAALRKFKSPFMVKQSELLRMLRNTYRDRTAVDPVEKCQDADCLLVDEVGLSAGGRDELPLLHEVLDYRHGEMLPTIITGNIRPEQLRDVFGERLADRLRQSAFGVLLFAGKSNRPEAKNRYFQET